MVAYYRDQNDRFDVHATFSDELSDYLPAILKLAMVDGDDLRFHALGRPEISFRFVRVGSVVEVSTQAIDASASSTTNQIQ